MSAKSEEALDGQLERIAALGLDALIVIGGEDTLGAAAQALPGQAAGVLTPGDAVTLTAGPQGARLVLSGRREAELAKNGFMPLVHRKNSDFAAFIGAQSLHKPAEYDDPDATANANLSAIPTPPHVVYDPAGVPNYFQLANLPDAAKCAPVVYTANAASASLTDP